MWSQNTTCWIGSLLLQEESLGVQTQVIRIYIKHLCLLNHLTTSWQKDLDFEASWVVE